MGKLCPKGKAAAKRKFDIGAPKKDGKFQPCGRKSAKGSKRKYPKCVPLAKAQRMTESQKKSAVKRKRAKPQGVGGKPTMVKTFTKSKGGQIKPRGCGVAKRGFGRAMKGK